MNFYEDVDKVFHDWNYGHPKILYGLIRSMKPAVIVEVGAYRAYGTAWMAQAAKENCVGHVYAIDNFSLKQFTSDRDAAGLKKRLDVGMSLESALTTPVNKKMWNKRKCVS